MNRIYSLHTHIALFDSAHFSLVGLGSGVGLLRLWSGGDSGSKSIGGEAASLPLGFPAKSSLGSTFMTITG